MSENAENQNNEDMGIPINFRILPRTPSFYSNRSLLQRGELGEVVITFFEVVPPLISAGSDEDSAQLKTLGVNAESQVRIILHPERFLDFARLIKNWAMEVVNENAPVSEADKEE